MMTFEWDAAKSAEIKAERGASFEELEKVIVQDGGLLDVLDNPGYPKQSRYIVRLDQRVWVVIVEERGEILRIVTAWVDRKMRKIYG